MSDPFTLEEKIIRDTEYVRVKRLTCKKGSRLCRYEKVFKKREMNYWLMREKWFFLLQFSSRGINHVVRWSALEQDEEGDALTSITTYDAGITIFDWLMVKPIFQDGATHAHPFVHIGMFLKLMSACLKALHEIHRNGIIHCDIKSDNICLPYEFCKNGFIRINFDSIRLIDFAFAITPDLGLNIPLPINPDKTDYHSERFKNALRADQARGPAPYHHKYQAYNLDYREDIYSLSIMARAMYDRTDFLWPDDNKKKVEAKRCLDEFGEWLKECGSDSPKPEGWPHERWYRRIDRILDGMLDEWSTYGSFKVGNFAAETGSDATPLAKGVGPTPITPLAREEKPTPLGEAPKPTPLPDDEQPAPPAANRKRPFRWISVILLAGWALPIAVASFWFGQTFYSDRLKPLAGSESRACPQLKGFPNGTRRG
jgi:serine/threonine protein kinase